MIEASTTAKKIMDKNLSPRTLWNRLYCCIFSHMVLWIKHCTCMSYISVVCPYVTIPLRSIDIKHNSSNCFHQVKYIALVKVHFQFTMPSLNLSWSFNTLFFQYNNIFVTRAFDLCLAKLLLYQENKVLKLQFWSNTSIDESS